MSNLAGTFEIVDRGTLPVFQNTQDYDVALYTDSTTQAIHLGCGSTGTQPSTVKITSSNMDVVGNINFTGNLMKNGQAFQSGTPGLSNTSTAVYVLSGSNLGVGTSTPAQCLDVNGAIATGGQTRIAQDGGLSNVSINASSIQSGIVSTTRLPAASTVVSGVVTLLDSFSSVSTSNAATPNAVKSAYDLAMNALPKAGGTLTGAVTGTSITTTGDIVVGGSLTVNGTSTTIDTQQVLIEDNLITLNKNQTGTPASFLQSGIEVERGDQPNYMFVFDEATDLFKVGMSNQLQAVSTRDDSLVSGYPYYNAATSNFLMVLYLVQN